MGMRGRLSYASETLYFVTTTVAKHSRVFVKDKYCDILINNIKHYQRRYQFRILGYAIMPSHFHWVVNVDPELGLVSDVMRDIKKYSAWDILEALEVEKEDKLMQLFAREAQRFNDQRRKFWIKRFDDEVIRNAGMLRTKLEYIHNNPVKAGLVTNPEDYKYSSARNHVLDDHSVIEVDTDW